MPYRLAVGQAKYALATAAVAAAADWRFRFVFAPMVLIAALLLASVTEAVTSYRCCSGDDKFDFRSVTWEKIETVALVVAAGCLDAAFYVLGRYAEPVFPLFSRVNVPLVTITWAIWLIWAEANEARKNVTKLRGRNFRPPFPGGVVELIDTLKRADPVPVAQRRRRTDRIIADAERAVGTTPREKP